MYFLHETFLNGKALKTSDIIWGSHKLDMPSIFIRWMESLLPTGQSFHFQQYMTLPLGREEFGL